LEAVEATVAVTELAIEGLRLVGSKVEGITVAVAVLA